MMKICPHCRKVSPWHGAGAGSCAHCGSDLDHGKTLHTPGPWRIVSDAQGPCMVMHPLEKGRAIANLGSAFLPADGYHDPVDETEQPCPESNGTFHSERVANVRLVAASPDLLAAARLSLEAAEWVLSGGNPQQVNWENVARANREAIRKAEGGL